MNTEDKKIQEDEIFNEETSTQEELNTENQDINTENLTTDLPDFEAELAKEKDKFLRLFAEFENYKKRTAKERLDLLTTAGQDVISAMLPILDDFERALTEISKSDDKDLLKGVEIIYNKFSNTLKNKGLELIEVNPTDPFDSDLHEAVTQISVSTDDLKGKIIDVLEKGYKLGEKIIRYPKVVVGQ